SRHARERSRLVRQEAAARREAELHREHLHSLLMQAPTPIVILRGPKHTIELANPLACAVWGKRDIVERPFVEALPELQCFGERLDGVLATGEPYVGKEVAVD